MKLYWLTHSQVVALTLYFHLGTIRMFKMPLVLCFPIFFNASDSWPMPSSTICEREGNTGIFYYPWSSITQQLNKPEEKKRDLWTQAWRTLCGSAGGKSGTKWVQLGNCKVVESRMPCRKDSPGTDRILEQPGVAGTAVLKTISSYSKRQEEFLFLADSASIVFGWFLSSICTQS